MTEMFDVLNEQGEFTDRTASREECHQKGYYHRAVVVFVVSKENQVLLQKRSASKKQWPSCWDITAGGHVLAGEFGYQAVIREAKEEINLDIDVRDLLFIGATTSHIVKGDILDNHFNEYYILRKDIEIDDLKLQEEEVEEIKWFTMEDILSRIQNRDKSLTGKDGCWDFLKKYLERNRKK